MLTVRYNVLQLLDTIISHKPNKAYVVRIVGSYTIENANIE